MATKKAAAKKTDAAVAPRAARREALAAATTDTAPAPADVPKGADPKHPAEDILAGQAIRGW